MEKRQQIKNPFQPGHNNCQFVCCLQHIAKSGICRNRKCVFDTYQSVSGSCLKAAPAGFCACAVMAAAAVATGFCACLVTVPSLPERIIGRTCNDVFFTSSFNGSGSRRAVRVTVSDNSGTGSCSSSRGARNGLPWATRLLLMQEINFGCETEIQTKNQCGFEL